LYSKPPLSRSSDESVLYRPFRASRERRVLPKLSRQTLMGSATSTSLMPQTNASGSKAAFIQSPQLGSLSGKRAGHNACGRGQCIGRFRCGTGHSLTQMVVPYLTTRKSGDLITRVDLPPAKPVRRATANLAARNAQQIALPGTVGRGSYSSVGIVPLFRGWISRIFFGTLFQRPPQEFRDSVDGVLWEPL
jgi:hypothetical protein